MIEQKAALRFVGITTQTPGPLGLADGIPGPHGTRFDGFTITAHAAHLAVHRFNPHPAAVGDTLRRSRQRIHIQIIMRVYLP